MVPKWTLVYSTQLNPSRRGLPDARIYASSQPRSLWGSGGADSPRWVTASLAGCPPSSHRVPARAFPAARTAAPAVAPVPLPRLPAAGGGAAGPWLVIGRSAAAPLPRPVPLGERSAERWSAGATMAGLWVNAVSLIVAESRGQRSLQQLMRSAALWTRKVRSDGAPRRPGLQWTYSPAPPGGVQCRAERPSVSG